MNTLQMNTFLTIAKYKSYTKASNELQISVSALSRQISSMEAELNLKLFSRDNKSVELTPSGEYFYERISKIFNDYENTVENTQKVYQGYSGSLSIAVLDDMTLNGSIQETFHKFQKKNPGVSLQLQRESFQGVTDGIANGKYDCAFSLFFTLNQYDFLKYIIIKNTEEGILLSKRNPLSRKSYFDPQQFRNQTFILIKSHENSYMHQGPREFFRKHNISPRVIYAPDADTATLMVEAGLGVAFSNSQAIGTFNPDMKFLSLPDKQPMTSGSSLVLAWDENNTNPVLKTWTESFR